MGPGSESQRDHRYKFRNRSDISLSGFFVELVLIFGVKLKKPNFHE